MTEPFNADQNDRALGLLAVNDDINARAAAAGGPDKMIHSLVAGLAQQARIAHWLVISVSMSFLLTLGLALTGFTVFRNTGTLDQSVENARIACTAGNDFRIADRHLWNQILALPLGQSGNTLPADQVAAIHDVMDEVFQLRPCP